MRETLSTKKPFVITAAIGLVVIAALLVYGILVTPARQPYRDALAQYKNVDTALARTSVSLNTTTASDDEFAKNIDAVKSAFTSLKKENEALSKKEVLTNGEGKGLYDAYDKKLQAYMTYNANVIASIQKVRPVLHACSVDMGAVKADAEGATLMHTCAAKMQAATDVPDADYKQMTEGFAKSYAELATILDEMAALPDPKGADKARYDELNQTRTQVVSDFSQISNTFSKNVQETRQQILTTNTAKALQDYLTNKSRIFA